MPLPRQWLFQYSSQQNKPMCRCHNIVSHKAGWSPFVFLAKKEHSSTFSHASFPRLSILRRLIRWSEPADLGFWSARGWYSHGDPQNPFPKSNRPLNRIWKIYCSSSCSYLLLMLSKSTHLPTQLQLLRLNCYRHISTLIREPDGICKPVRHTIQLFFWM